MTNEQSVAEAGRLIEKLKKEYMSYLTPIVSRMQDGGKEPSVEELLRCQQLGTEYFNYVESFVGDSGLLGAHENGTWITGFAETCQNILYAYIVHVNFLRSYSSILNGTIQQPSSNACANMQRMVKEYLPSENWQQLNTEFENCSLPTQGFKVRAVSDKKKVPIWQLMTSVSIGVLALITSVAIAFLVSEPSATQEFILRGLFAISLASIASIIPGFINVETGARGAAAYFGIYAGGAIAIFVLIWMFNPPKIEEPAPANQPVHVKTEQNS